MSTSQQREHAHLTVTLLERANCHLCDEARDIVTQIVDEVNRENETLVSVKTTDIDTEPQLQSQYDWEVPVVLIGQRQHSFHRVDPARFRAALTKAVRHATNQLPESDTYTHTSAGRQPE